jgi:hypothetical protein
MVNIRLFIFFFLNRNHTSVFLSILIEKPTIRSINGTDVSTNTSSIGLRGLNTSGVVISGFVVRFVVLNFLIMLVWLVQKQKKGQRKNIGYIICLCYLPKKIQVIY